MYYIPTTEVCKLFVSVVVATFVYIINIYWNLLKLQNDITRWFG